MRSFRTVITAWLVIVICTAMISPVFADISYLQVLRKKIVTVSVDDAASFPLAEHANDVCEQANTRLAELVRDADAEYSHNCSRIDPRFHISEKFIMEGNEIKDIEVTYTVFNIATLPWPDAMTPSMIAENKLTRDFLQELTEEEITDLQNDTRYVLDTGKGTAEKHPELKTKVETTLAALVTCLRAHPLEDIGGDTACTPQYDAYLAAIDAFTDVIVDTAAEVVRLSNLRLEESDCKEGDILCSPINLLINTSDPYRNAYVNRIRSEGFQVLFLSIISGLSTVTAGIAVLGLLYGAFLYVTSHGDEEQIGKAKQFITLTLIGLVLIILAYAIIIGIRDIFYAPI